MDIKVSVIVPSLNVADYIEECMDSIIGQTLQEIEIICIDAGSTDGTFEILQRYAKKDKRIRLIRSEKKSYGYQINLGIQMAKGEYLGIVETDDYIDTMMYQELYQTAIEHDLDFVKAGFDVFVTPSEGERYLLRYPMTDVNQVISSEYFINKELSNDIYIWNGIYKLAFLREYQIQLNETPGAAFQDCGFRYLVDIHLRRGMFLDKSFYRYRRDNSSSSTYQPKCVQYNLSECKYLRERIEKEQITERKILAFIARETVMMALEPYITFRGCCKADGETKAALNEFREIIKKDREYGLLQQEEMLPKHWIEMRLFTEYPEACEAYIAISADARYAPYRQFIEKISEKEQIVVFGAGKVATYALCLLRMNGVHTIQAFCDNNQDKWGSNYMGYPVLSPEDVISKYKSAHFLIANRIHYTEIEEQLCLGGIEKSSISVYTLPLLPMECTNYFMKLYQ